MFKKKSPIVVGITTVFNECLRISVPAVSRLGRNVVLVIYNDNPDTKVSKRQIRRLGYRGRLHIINGDKNVGQLRARLGIVNAVRQYKMDVKWIVLADDDDVLVNADVPNVAANNFAILQNMVVLRTRLVDVLRIMRDVTDYSVDNENVYMVRPHMGLAGTLVRMDYMADLADVLAKCDGQIAEIDASLGIRPPVDVMMWAALNIVARDKNEFSAPIYMDRVNYIAIDLDTAREKYGMRLPTGKNAGTQVRNAIERYVHVVQEVLNKDKESKNMIETDA